MCCQRKFNSSTFKINQPFTHYCSLHLHMWCDWKVSGITLFLPSNNTYFLINVVGFQVILCGLYTVSPVIIPLFEAFCNSHCSDIGKWIPGFYLNHGNVIGFLVNNQNLFISNYLWKEFWISLKHPLKVPDMCAHDSASAPHSAREIWIWWQSIHVQMVFKNCLNWPKSNSQNFSSFMDSNFFQRQVLSLDQYFHVFCWLINDSNVQDFQQKPNHIQTWKITQINCILPITCFPQGAFNISKVCKAFFPS